MFCLLRAAAREGEVCLIMLIRGRHRIHTQARRALLAVVMLLPAIVAGRPAMPAPPLAAPTGTIVNVSTEAQLQAAVRQIASNTTIVIAPGTYQLTSTLYINGTYTNVGIRGATRTIATTSCSRGPGMTNSAYGNTPHGIWTGGNVQGVTIANLTIRDFFLDPIMFNGGTESPLVHNVHLIDAGEQFIKSNPDTTGGGVDNGVVDTR